MGQQRQEVLSQLRGMITHGEYVPGRLFSENELMERLGVSRAPIREALAILVQDGILDQLHRKGVMVRVIGPAETLEVLQLRQSLEELVVRQLANDPNPDRLDGVEEVLQDMDRAAADNDAVAFLDADTDFHCGLARKAGYFAAADMLRTLRDKIRIVGLDSLQQDSGFAGANSAHRELVRHILANEPDRAQSVLREHLDATSRLLVRTLQADPAPDVARVRELVAEARKLRRHEGHVHGSIELLQQAAELARESNNRQFLVQVLLELAATRRSLRDFDTAGKHAFEALQISTGSRYRAGQAWANSELGRIAVESKRGDADMLDRAAELFQGLQGEEDDIQRGWNYYARALRAAEERDEREATSLAENALEVLERVDDDYGRVKVLELLGRLAAERQQHDEARRLLSRARELAAAKGYKPLLAATTLEEGRLLRRSPESRPQEAADKLRTAFQLFRNLEDGTGMSVTLKELEADASAQPTPKADRR